MQRFLQRGGVGTGVEIGKEKETGKHGEYCQLGWDMRSRKAEGVCMMVLEKRASGGAWALRRKGGESWWNVMHTVGA